MPLFQKGNKFGKSNKGRILSSRTKEKMRNAKIKNPTRYWLGKKLSSKTKNKLSISHIGKKHSEEHKRKIGKSHIGKPSNKGWRKKNPKTPENRRIRGSLEYRLWRESVFKRDNYACVWCGARSEVGKTVFLHADHIKPFAYFPELRFAIDNGRTLCIDCHKKTETYLWKIKVTL